MDNKAFLDTNILLYAISTKDQVKHAVAKPIALGDATISIQVINEASANCIKKFHFNEDMVKKFVNSSYNRYRIVNLSQSIFLQASTLRENYNFSYFDSIIVSAALDSKCTTLYSEDMQHELIVDNTLTIINPFL